MFRLMRSNCKSVATVLRCSRCVRPVFSARLVVSPMSSSSFSTSASRLNTVGTVGPVEPPKQLTFKDVEVRVLKAIKAWDRFPQDRADKLTLDARFVEDLGLDSLDLVEITMSLEDEFGFEIPESDVDKLKTPRDIHKYVCEHEDVYE